MPLLRGKMLVQIADVGPAAAGDPHDQPGEGHTVVQQRVGLFVGEGEHGVDEHIGPIGVEIDQPLGHADLGGGHGAARAVGLAVLHQRVVEIGDPAGESRRVRRRDLRADLIQGGIAQSQYFFDHFPAPFRLDSVGFPDAEVDGVHLLTLGGLALGFEQLQGLHKACKFFEAEVADIEIRQLAVQQLGQFGGENPAVVLRILLGQRHQRLAHHVQIGAALDLGGFFLFLGGLAAGSLRRDFGRFAGLLPPGGVQQVDVGKLVAGRDEGLGRFLLAQAQHVFFRFPQAGGQPGEVAVGGDDAERVDLGLIQQVHGVDDQRGVRGILAADVGVLLDGLDAVVQHHVLPAAHLPGRPVAVNALDNDVAQTVGFVEDDAGVFAGDVFRVDEDGDFHFSFHGVSFRRREGQPTSGPRRVSTSRK